MAKAKPRTATKKVVVEKKSAKKARPKKAKAPAVPEPVVEPVSESVAEPEPEVIELPQVAASKPNESTVIEERDEEVDGVLFRITPQGRFKYAGQDQTKKHVFNDDGTLSHTIIGTK